MKIFAISASNFSREKSHTVTRSIIIAYFEEFKIIYFNCKRSLVFIQMLKKAILFLSMYEWLIIFYRNLNLLSLRFTFAKPLIFASFVKSHHKIQDKSFKVHATFIWLVFLMHHTYLYTKSWYRSIIFYSTVGGIFSLCLFRLYILTF